MKNLCIYTYIRYIEIYIYIHTYIHTYMHAYVFIYVIFIYRERERKKYKHHLDDVGTTLIALQTFAVELNHLTRTATTWHEWMDHSWSNLSY